jgi:hypothetical protein
MSTPSTDSAKNAFSNNLTERIGVYSLAAAVAGVGMLALAEPAAGEVVVTKTNLSVTYLTPVSLDFDKDGRPDLRLSIHLYEDFSFSSLVNVAFFPFPAGGIVGQAGPYASALIQGAKIGPSDHFYSGGNEAAGVTIERISGSSRGVVRIHGLWPGGTPSNRFLGVKLPIDGATHYGWIRLKLTVDPTGRSGPVSATISEYAYETIANKPIIAGIADKSTAEVQLPHSIQNQAGPSLGMLAAGADGLPLWRREDPSASQ